MIKRLQAWGLIVLLPLATSLHAQAPDSNADSSLPNTADEKERKWYKPWSGREKEEKGILVTIADPFAEMHTHHGRGYPIFHVIEKFEQVRILKNRVDWYLVLTEDGKKGWVRREQLENTLDIDGAQLNFANPGWQDYERNRWRTSLLGSRFDKAIAYTVSIGYQSTENILVEAKYTQAFGEFSNLKLAGAHITHQAFPHWRVSPFISLGAGIIQTFPDSILVEAEDRQDNYIAAGGGLMFYATHRLMLRLEYTNHTILTTRDVNEEVEEWKAGFSVLF